jgi:copper chaperone CopZ
MEIEFYVQNVRCGGCVSAIQTGLKADPRVQGVAVDIPTGRVVVSSTADIRPELSAQLRTLGYPERAVG